MPYTPTSYGYDDSVDHLAKARAFIAYMGSLDEKAIKERALRNEESRAKRKQEMELGIQRDKKLEEFCAENGMITKF